MFKNLKEFVNFLEEKGELIRVKEFVNPIYEIAEYTNRISKQPNGGKAILFENTGTQFPILTNMLGSEKRILYTLGANNFNDIDERIQSFIQEIMSQRQGLMSKLKILPTLAEAGKWIPKITKKTPSCQEVIQMKPQLSKLPILKCWPQDGGKFITLPLVHTNCPKTGTRNVGMYRMQVFSDNSTGMHWHKHKTGARHFDDFKGDKMPVAVTLGGDPIYTYVATAPLPDGIDEYLLAGFLRKNGVKLTKCLTQDIYVPEDSDFVIEGYISKNEPPVIEGPFGDHTGFYSLADYYPTFHITCITHKKDAIYPATIVGIPPQEDKYIALATEKIFLSPIKFTIAPEIEDLYLPEEGVGHNFAVVKIKKRYPGQAIKIAHAMWGAGQMMFNKMLLVVDGDIDIRNRKELAKHIVKNYTPKQDTYFSRGPLDILDHSSPVCGFGGKLCIDATSKLPQENITKQSNKNFLKFIHINKDINTNTPLTSNEISLEELDCAHILVVIDNIFDIENTYQNLWLLGGNVDPVRDTTFIKDSKNNYTLILDARSKKGRENFKREWPDIVESLPETKAIINNLIKNIF